MKQRKNRSTLLTLFLTILVLSCQLTKAQSDLHTPVKKAINNPGFQKASSITVAAVNLTPYKPSDWDDPIVASVEKETGKSASKIYNNQHIYIDWAAINNGTINITQAFHTKLFIDDNLWMTYNTNSLESNYYIFMKDIDVGMLGAGMHTIKIVVDANSEVSESNEKDNEFSITKTITVVPYNLAPYQPMGWDNKIVVSLVKSTTVSSEKIYANQTIYVDWAAINNGENDITQQFTTELYVDGELTKTQPKTGLTWDTYLTVSDISVGPLPEGEHILKIVLDANGNVDETDETDNEYTRTITILKPVPDIHVAQTSITLEQSSVKPAESKAAKVIRNLPVYVPSLPDSLILDKYLDPDGNEIDKIKIGGHPPKVFRVSSASISENAITLPNVPAFDWSFGCAATSGAMMAGYYDNEGFTNMYTGPTNNGLMPLTNQSWGWATINGEQQSLCPLSASREGLDGRKTPGHVDDYWIKYLNSDTDPYLSQGRTQHVYGDCTGDFMKTSQSAFKNSDGSTTFYFANKGLPFTDYAEDDGGYGLQQFFESKGYIVTKRFNQFIQGYNGNTQGFTFEQYVAEIDAGRPVLIHVTGHTMLGFGYDLTGNTVYLHDTWDYNDHSMTWGGKYSDMAHFGISVYELAASNVLRINNVGAENLSISSIAGDKDWLSIGDVPGIPFSISPWGYQEIKIHIDWPLVGTTSQNGKIVINSSDPDEASVEIRIIAVPHICTTLSTPVITSVTQPTCTNAKGSIKIGSLPADGSWTLTNTTDKSVISGGGTNKTIQEMLPGTYAYFVTDRYGCSSLTSDNVTINSQPPTPAAPTITLSEAVLRSSSETGNQWYNEAGLIPGATNREFSVTRNGSYYAIVSESGCSSAASNTINVTSTAAETYLASDELLIYPNPATRTFEINGLEHKATITVSDLNGKELLTKEVSVNESISLSGLSKGLYMVKITTSEFSYVKKLIKN